MRRKIDNISLFPCAPQHEVDGDHLNHLDKSVVFRVDNAVGDLLNGQIVCHRIDAGRLILLDMGGRLGIRSFQAASLLSFRLIGLDRPFLPGVFFGPELSRISYPRDFIKLSWEICFTRPPVLRRLGRSLLWRLLFEMLADFSQGCSPSPPTTRRFRRYFRKVTRNCDRLSPEMPMRATNATGSAVRHKAIMRAVSQMEGTKKPASQWQVQDAGFNHIPRTEHTAKKKCLFL